MVVVVVVDVGGFLKSGCRGVLWHWVLRGSNGRRDKGSFGLLGQNDF